MALRLPKINMPRPSSGFLTKLAGGSIGRVFAPLTPILVLLGLKDRSSKFILNIGDEGSTLVQVQGGQVTDAVFAEAANEEGWQALREMLSTDPTAPIVVVADVLEQMFREDTVPKVGFFDRSKIVKRRLDLTFPNELLKAALPAARKRGAPQAVLFTALPMSPHLERWVAFLDEFPNQVRGFYMLPLEAVGVAGKLAPPADGETRKVWRALISQEAASGFRQVFDLGGKMVVTRLTQKASQPLTPEAEAMLIERELRSSISYVKRLGFSDADRLDVVLLADPAVCRAIDDRELPATTVTAFTPYQAGVMLGLGEVGREDSPFADVLLGLWVAAKRRPLLMLPTKKILGQLKMTSIVRWSAVATAALTLLAVYYMGSLITAFAESGVDLGKLESDLDQANATLETEKARMKNYPIPLDDLTEVADSQDRLQAQEIDFVALMRKVSGALGQEARATNISFEASQPPMAAKQAAAKKPGNGTPELPPVAYTISLKVKLAKTSSGDETQAALQEAKTVLARLGDALPGLTVQATKLPGNTMGNQIIEGSSDTAQKQASGGQAQTAEFTIRRDK